MTNYINALKQKAYSETKEESIKGIEEIVATTNEAGSLLLEILKSSDDRFIVAEKISLAYDKYLNMLKMYLGDTDKDLSFWAATLIINHNINDAEAEKKLLDTILVGALDKAYVASTILSRVKNPKVKKAISERLKDLSLPDQAKKFFQEKLM